MRVTLSVATIIDTPVDSSNRKLEVPDWSYRRPIDGANETIEPMQPSADG